MNFSLILWHILNFLSIQLQGIPFNMNEIDLLQNTPPDHKNPVRRATIIRDQDYVTPPHENHFNYPFFLRSHKLDAVALLGEKERVASGNGMGFLRGWVSVVC